MRTAILEQQGGIGYSCKLRAVTAQARSADSSAHLVGCLSDSTAKTTRWRCWQLAHALVAECAPQRLRLPSVLAGGTHAHCIGDHNTTPVFRSRHCLHIRQSLW